MKRMNTALTLLSMAVFTPLPAHASFENSVVTGVHSNFEHLANATSHAGHVIERDTVSGAHQVVHFTTHAAHVVATTTTRTARQIEADTK